MPSMERRGASPQTIFMLKNNLLKTACLSILLGLSVMNVGAQTSPTLKATDIICYADSCSNWTDSITGNPSKCVGGGFWDRTYNGSAKPLQMGEFLISHNAGFDIYSFWGGFTTGSNGDTQCYSSECPRPAQCVQSGSMDWVQNQWGVMAGGGLTTPPTVVKGQPYFVAYWMAKLIWIVAR